MVHHSIVLNFISLFHWEKVQDRTVERRVFGHGALRYGQQNRSPQLSLRRAGLFLFQIEGSAGCTGLGGT